MQQKCTMPMKCISSYYTYDFSHFWYIYGFCRHVLFNGLLGYSVCCKEAGRIVDTNR